MKYKVVEFIYSTGDGGAENLVKNYALMLNKDLFDVTILVLRDYKQTAVHYEIIKNNIKIYSVFKHNSIPFKAVQMLNYQWYVPPKIKDILIEADIIHIHLGLLKFIVPFSQFLENKRLFYTCHNEPYIHLGKHSENEAARKLIAENNLQIIALHESMRKEINHLLGIDNTIVIKNGIDSDSFRNISETKAQIRKSLNIPTGAFVVGHVGRFHKQKNHQFLVNVFDEIRKKRDNAFLLLIGNGALKKTIENKLNFLGLRGRFLILSHRSDIPRLMKAMDVFVFPSLYEGFPLTLIETQVSNLRSIVSDRVSKEVFLTEYTVPMSLDSSICEWCRVVLDESIKGVVNGNIENYDIRKGIKRLEKLYLGNFEDGY